MSADRVALFVGCLNDTLFPQAARATVEVLERVGCHVEFPFEQTCCGQMHHNTGYQRTSQQLAKHFLDVFRGYDHVVSPSGSCTAMVRHFYPTQLGVEPPKVHELSEFLIDVLGIDDVGAYFPHTVTLHPTCHSLRVLRVGDRPMRLLSNVRGLKLLELPHADECCGFGGTFAVKNAAVSSAMLHDKLRHIGATRAEVVVATDTSCLMHIGGGLRRAQAGVRTMHLAEVLAATEAA